MVPNEVPEIKLERVIFWQVHHAMCGKVLVLAGLFSGPCCFGNESGFCL
jgi:hypothetical protein